METVVIYTDIKNAKRQKLMLTAAAMTTTPLLMVPEALLT